MAQQPAIDLELFLGLVRSDRDSNNLVVYVAESVSKKSWLGLFRTHAGGLAGACAQGIGCRICAASSVDVTAVAIARDGVADKERC